MQILIKMNRPPRQILAQPPECGVASTQTLNPPSQPLQHHDK
jgi:hypothetical protein